MKRAWLACGVVAVLVSWLVVSQEVAARNARAKERVSTAHEIMEGIIGPNCGSLGEAFKGTPEGDDAWKKLALNAAMLNEAGFILVEDDRCPDGIWADAAKTLRECSQVLSDKIAAKDLAGAKEAFGAMTQACATCHKEHKK